MKVNGNKMLRNIISSILVMFLLVPCNISATEIDTAVPYASDYLSLYSAYVYVTSSGEVQVWFEVMGTGDMDEIGSLAIMLYDTTDDSNWKLLKTFLHDKTDGMLFYDDYYVSSHVSWTGGSTSKHYKAYVCVWAGKDGDGDTRYFWANQVN